MACSWWQPSPPLRPVQATQRAAFDASVLAWLGPSEAYAPQTVDFVPFPFEAYYTRPFYGILVPLFSFFFLFTVRMGDGQRGSLPH